MQEGQHSLTLLLPLLNELQLPLQQSIQPPVLRIIMQLVPDILPQEQLLDDLNSNSSSCSNCNAARIAFKSTPV